MACVIDTIIMLWIVYEYVGCGNPIRKQQWKNKKHYWSYLN